MNGIEFSLKHRNRFCFPTKEILVIEDDLWQQSRLAKKLYELFGHQSSVIVTFCPTALAAFAYLMGLSHVASGGVYKPALPRLIILDHDLQHGDGVEFIAALRAINMDSIPIITASGIHENNARLMAHGATYNYTKNAVIDGEADGAILSIIGEFSRCPAI